MITVPEATEKIIKRSRYLSEALSKDIINISSLARYIKPEIEGLLFKRVSLSSVIMALKRLSGNVNPETPYQDLFNNRPELTVKTNLALVVYDGKIQNEFASQDVTATNTSAGSVVLGSKTSVLSKADENSKLYYPVSSISVAYPKEAQTTAGIYYFFLKSLAWERINILNLFTTPSELIIVVGDEDTQRALSVLRSIFDSLS